MDNKYLALYRKYRPKTFDEVQDQQHIVKTLQNIIKFKKLSHAYLFCGPHGTGKTSLAKIFANTINCTHSKDILKPCDECIKNVDHNLDIVEIDAASNTSVEDIRILKEKIQHMPTSSKYKIYIIDEVHMLSKSAFNALLKTLEEPPTHVIFIFATTDPQKIPLTILSRVQRFNFSKIDKNVLINHLKNIFDIEKIKYEPEAINLIATLGNGSVRDTLSIADQIAIYAGDKGIKLVDLEKLFGITNVDNIIKLINFASTHQIKELLELTNKLVNEGIDIEKMVNQMINLLKDYVIYWKTNSNDLLEHFDIADLNKVSISKEKVYAFITELVNLLKDIKFNDIPLQALELGFIKLATLETNDENFSNVITNNFHTKNSVSADKDFEIVGDLYKNNGPKQKNTTNKINSKDLDQAFGFSNIANNHEIKIKKIDINDVLQKTDEMLVNEKTAEIELRDLENSIVNDLNSDDGQLSDTDSKDFEIAGKEKPNLEDGLLSDEMLYDCIYTSQHLIHTKKIQNYRESDKVALKLIDTKLGSNEEQAKVILRNLEVILSSKDFVVFSSKLNMQIKILNKNAYEKFLVNAAAKLFGRYVHLFAFTKEQQANAKTWWSKNKNIPRKLMQLDDLEPKYRERNIELENDVASVFGDKFKK